MGSLPCALGSRAGTPEVHLPEEQRWLQDAAPRGVALVLRTFQVEGLMIRKGILTLGLFAPSSGLPVWSWVCTPLPTDLLPKCPHPCGAKAGVGGPPRLLRCTTSFLLSPRPPLREAQNDVHVTQQFPVCPPSSPLPRSDATCLQTGWLRVTPGTVGFPCV